MTRETIRFNDDVVVVTGGASGLGRSYALLLGLRGARVVVNDADETARSVVDEIVVQGGQAIASIHRIGTEASADAIMADAVRHYGRVDALINNAGIVRDKSFHSMTAEHFESVLDVHLRGAFYLTQRAYSGMRAQGYGRIVNTTSSAGVYGNFGQANYASAKMALVGLARTIAVEGAAKGVSANVLAPGARTAMTAGLMSDDVAMAPDDVAPMAAWLCHRQCPWNGEILVAADGRFARIATIETQGIRCESPTIETIADHAAEIMDLDGFVFPSDIAMASAIPGRRLPA